jgi:hypothetical protein
MALMLRRFLRAVASIGANDLYIGTDAVVIGSDQITVG